MKISQKIKLIVFITASAIMLTAIPALFAGCGEKATTPATLDTFAKLDDCGLYSMEYNGDYAFDEFLLTGAKNDNELADFLNEKLLEGSNIEIKAPGAGCTTFSGKIDSGDRIFARNFDFNSAIPLVLKTNPSGGYKSISTVNLEFIGYSADNHPNADDPDSLLPLLAAPYIPLDGVNEKGLSVGILQINWTAARQTDVNKVTLPTTTMMRMVLDKAETVDEAISLMKKYNISDSLGSNFHYQIADRFGKSVVVEYVDNPVLKSVEMLVIEQGSSEDYHCAENFLLSPMGALLQQNGYPQGIGSKARYGVLKSALTINNGAFADEAEAMDLLKAADQGSRTHWSVVYNLSKTSALFVPKTQYDSPFLFGL